MQTILQPLTRTITSQGNSFIPPVMRGLPFSINRGSDLPFANPYTETQNNAQIIAQQQQQQSMNQRISNRIFNQMAPGPNTRISLETDQLRNIQSQREQLLKQDRDAKLARVSYNKSKHGTQEQFEDMLKSEQTTDQKIQEVKKKLERNAKEESKSNPGYVDPVDKIVAQEKADLELQLKKLQSKPTKQQIAEMKKEQAPDKFQDRMEKMTELRKQRDAAQTQEEKDAYTQKLKDLVAKPKPREFTDSQVQDITNFKAQMQQEGVPQDQIDTIMSEIQRDGLLPYNAYNPTDPRNKFRNPEPPNGGDPNGNGDQNNDDIENMKQQAIGKLTDIINAKDTTDQEKSKQVQQHIDQLTPSEINIIYNVYTQEKVSDTKNNVHGHVDADTILTSLIQ